MIKDRDFDFIYGLECPKHCATCDNFREDGEVCAKDEVRYTAPLSVCKDWKKNESNDNDIFFDEMADEGEKDFKKLMKRYKVSKEDLKRIWASCQMFDLK